MGKAVLSRGEKLLTREAKSATCGAQVGNEWGYTSTPSKCLHKTDRTLRFRRVRKMAKSDYKLRHGRPSVRME
jgi:hypothetical protein